MTTSDCIFCQIAAGSIPAAITYEDNAYLGFMDISPLNPGHSLLIPKKHYRWVYDVPNPGQYWAIANKIALASIRAFGSDYLSFLTLGNEVPHAHIHLIPRFKDDIHSHGIVTTSRKKVAPNILNEQSQKLQKIIRHEN